MALHSFCCEDCGKEFSLLGGYNAIATCRYCGGKSNVLFTGLSPSVAVYDTVDKDRDKKVIRDANKLIRERGEAHQRSDAELGEYIETQGGMKATVNGLIDKDKKKCI